MRLLCDLHVSPNTVEHLRSLGHEARRANELLPATASDQELLDLAASGGWVLVTQDLDFSALLAASAKARPSVVSLRLRFPRVARVNALLAAALEMVTDVLDAGAIVVVEESRIRIRKLPIGVGA